MTRLHPADLRALVAALIARENPTHYGPEPAVKATDTLLAELRKSEPTPADLCPRCQHNEAMGAQSEPAEPSGNPGELRAEIREELDADSRTITVYPCPKCGNPDRDADAVLLQHVLKVAEQFGWDRMCPLTDWMGDALLDSQTASDSIRYGEKVCAALVKERDEWKERAECAEGELVAYGRKLDDTLDRAEAAEAEVRQLQEEIMKQNGSDVNIRLVRMNDAWCDMKARAEKAEARVAELEKVCRRNHEASEEELKFVLSERDALKARVAELEAQYDRAFTVWNQSVPERDALRARAEVAEENLKAVAFALQMEGGDYAAEVRALKARVAELEGAASADERRLIAAAERAGITYVGCDTPDALADRVAELDTSLRQQVHQAGDLEREIFGMQARIRELEAVVKLWESKPKDELSQEVWNLWNETVGGHEADRARQAVIAGINALQNRVAELEGEAKDVDTHHARVIESWKKEEGIWRERELELVAERDRYRAALEHFTQWIMNNLTDRDEDTKEARNMARQARGALRGGEE